MYSMILRFREKWKRWKEATNHDVKKETTLLWFRAETKYFAWNPKSSVKSSCGWRLSSKLYTSGIPLGIFKYLSKVYLISIREKHYYCSKMQKLTRSLHRRCCPLLSQAIGLHSHGRRWVHVCPVSRKERWPSASNGRCDPDTPWETRSREYRSHPQPPSEREKLHLKSHYLFYTVKCLVNHPQGANRLFLLGGWLE